MFGFHVDGVTDVPDVGGRLWRMTYEKNGAELVWLDRPDEVKTFAIAFKTFPEDDTGVAHILEHSVVTTTAADLAAFARTLKTTSDADRGGMCFFRAGG